MSDEIVERFRTFIFTQFPLAQKRKIANDAPLLDGGIVDSMGILDMVTFIENEFRLTVADDEMVVENFASIAALAAFVQSKLSDACVRAA